MIQREFLGILEILPTLSHEQMQVLRRELENRLAVSDLPATSDENLQRRSLEAGIVSEIKPSIRDMDAYRDRKPVIVQGEPVSATITRERR